MNSTASQSSSSGCVGQAPCAPKSSGVATIPWPNAEPQSRLTNTRAVSGLSRETTQRARSSRVARRSPRARRPSPSRNAGTDGVTTSPESSSQLPRGKIRIGPRRARPGDEGRRHRRLQVGLSPASPRRACRGSAPAPGRSSGNTRRARPSGRRSASRAGSPAPRRRPRASTRRGPGGGRRWPRAGTGRACGAAVIEPERRPSARPRRRRSRPSPRRRRRLGRPVSSRIAQPVSGLPSAECGDRVAGLRVRGRHVRPGDRAASPVAASSSLSTKLPLAARPGPSAGSLPSGRTSSRSAVRPGAGALIVSVYVSRVRVRRPRRRPSRRPGPSASPRPPRRPASGVKIGPVDVAGRRATSPRPPARRPARASGCPGPWSRAAISASSALARSACAGVGIFALGLGADGDVLDVGEERGEPVEVAGRVRVELVVVALGAAEGRPHPDGRGVADPVGGVLRQVLLRLRPALLRGHQQLVIPRGDPLRRRRRRAAGRRRAARS